MQQLQSEMIHFYKMHRQSLRALHNIMKENNLIKQDEVIIDPEISSEARKIALLVEEIFDTNMAIKSRTKNIVDARKAAAYLIRKHTKLSLSEIRQFIGVGDHTTVMYNINSAKDLIDTADWFRNKIAFLEKRIEKSIIFADRN